MMNYNYFIKVSTTAFTACCIAMTALHASGETLSIEPQIKLEQEYTDNILFVNEDPQKDYITTLSPAFSVTKKTSRFESDFKVALDAIYYEEFDTLNSVDKRSSASLGYDVTERLKLGGSAGYLEDSRSDREIDESGLILSGEREQMRSGLFGKYQFSEVTAVDFSAGYLTEEITTPESEDNDTLTAEISLSRNISKFISNTTALFDISYMNYKSESPYVKEINYEDLPDDILVIIVDPEEGSVPTGLLQRVDSESDYDVLNITAGFSRELTERLSFFLKGGTSCVTSEEASNLSISASGTTLYDAQSLFDGGTNWGWLLFSGIGYSGLYDRIGINLSRDVQAASGQNGTTERSAVNLKYTRKITEKLSTSLYGTCYLNQSDRVSRSDVDELTTSSGAGMTYNFSKQWKGSLDWNYIRVEENEGDLWRDRNRVYARIVRNFCLN